MPLLLLQTAVIVACARAGAAIAKRLGQPEVVGEIAAGLALGPSLLGSVLPSASAALFPPESMERLRVAAQAGIVLFMFLTGLDFDLTTLRSQARAALLVAAASICLPFALGAGLGVALIEGHAPAGTPTGAFILFLGTAMSVTAFPVLARVLRERGMTRSKLGTAALACAALDDAVAWALLALATALASGRGGHGAPWTTLGSFTAGAALRALRGRAIDVPRAVERASEYLLMPLFFALSGLRTRLGLLASPETFALFLVVMTAAVAGKFAGGAAAARAAGLGRSDSLALGALINTRGLMELVVLNVGYDLGILSGELFSSLVLMALATTCMTGPALDLIERRRVD
ncbi:MAG: cation:proton antiporter [Elusimicrobia bacterium]|nr:cation:proton antiporter [Elusimicrobiota bacterium]